MRVEDGEVGTYTSEADISGAVNNTLDAVKLVKKGTASRSVVESTDGATRYEVVGAVESVEVKAPSVKTQGSILDGEKVGVRKKKIVQLIRKAGSGNAVAFKQPLGAAANGTVKPLDASTVDDDLVIAVAEEALDENTETNDAILAELDLL